MHRPKLHFILHAWIPRTRPESEALQTFGEEVYGLVTLPSDTSRSRVTSSTSQINLTDQLAPHNRFGTGYTAEKNRSAIGRLRARKSCDGVQNQASVRWRESQSIDFAYRYPIVLQER